MGSVHWERASEKSRIRPSAVRALGMRSSKESQPASASVRTMRRKGVPLSTKQDEGSCQRVRGGNHTENSSSVKGEKSEELRRKLMQSRLRKTELFAE
jgi:hypothetical protein